MKTEFELGFLAFEQGQGFDLNKSEDWQDGWKTSFKFWME